MKILKSLNKKIFKIQFFFLSTIDFPAPKKEIEKIIPNENFKIVK